MDVIYVIIIASYNWRFSIEFLVGSFNLIIYPKFDGIRQNKNREKRREKRRKENPNTFTFQSTHVEKEILRKNYIFDQHSQFSSFKIFAKSHSIMLSCFDFDWLRFCNCYYCTLYIVQTTTFFISISFVILKFEK